MSPKILIVGAGLFGLTVAERISNGLKLPVKVVETRSHIGGNAYSEIEPRSGVEIHRFGPHIFHTSNKTVWDYVNRFTEFNDYRHHVYSVTQGKLFPMPISLVTISQFYESALGPREAELLLERDGRGSFEAPTNLEEKAVNSFGWPIYEAFIKGYTRKQWQTDPRELPPETVARLPVRLDMNTRYFSDRWEGLPVDGYTTWFEKMIENPLVDVELETDFFAMGTDLSDWDLVVYTGPLDKFFGHKYGRLSWRSLDFEIEVMPSADFQGTSVVNYPDLETPFTRVVEYKHFYPERDYGADFSPIAREFSKPAQEGDEPYYPVNSAADRTILTKYREAADLPNVIFGGRLGSYMYLDMHMAIASALGVFENKIRPRFS